MTDPAGSPALATSEWRTLAEHPERRPWMIQTAYDVGRFAAVMALANAALPADSPYKITAADVQMLGRAIDALNYVHNDEMSYPEVSAISEEDAGITAVRRLAAKLAALLPPES